MWLPILAREEKNFRWQQFLLLHLCRTKIAFRTQMCMRNKTKKFIKPTTWVFPRNPFIRSQKKILKKIGPVVPRMCTIVFAVKFRYILTYRKPYFRILYGKTPFLTPPPPGGPTKNFWQMGKSRP